MFSLIYSFKQYTYNVHQLLHMVKSINNWGPLWAHSSFPFEAANHKLLQAIHSARGVISQIVRFLNIELTVKILERTIYPDCSTMVINFCENLVAPRTKKALKLSSVTYFGTKRTVNHSFIERFQIPKTTLIFSKIVKNGCLFETSLKINQRSCNFYAQISNGNFVELVNFLVDINTKQEITVCKTINTRPINYCSTLQNVTNISGEICIKTEVIVKPCVFIECNHEKYIIPLPNVLNK